MPKKILFIVTSHGELGSSGNASGSWLEELATPYWQFVDAGFDVTIASPKGGKAPIDPMSLEDAWISDNGRRFLGDATASAKMNGTQPLESISDEGLDGIFLVGGTATTWDFPHNPVIKRLAETLFARGDVVAGICHGVIGLVQTVDPNGEPLVKNRKLTSISNAEDVMMGVDKIVPVLPEDMLRKLRAIYSAAQPFGAHVVCDAPFFTGQNPASAEPLAKQIIDHLERKAAAAAA